MITQGYAKQELSFSRDRVECIATIDRLPADFIPSPDVQYLLKRTSPRCYYPLLCSFAQHKRDQARAVVVKVDAARTLFHDMGLCPLLGGCTTCIIIIVS